MADARKLEEDQLVQRLVPDPSQGPPNATVLRGYLGRGTDKGGWRLYLTDALDEHVELSEADILHTQKLPDDHGTLVWVPKTCTLRHVCVRSEEVQADFLCGHIGLRCLRPSHPAPCAGHEAPLPSLATVCSTVTCPPSVRGCMTHAPTCTTVVEQWPPSHPQCPSVPCPSHTTPCLSHTPCPSVPCQLLSHVPCPSVPCLSYTTPCKSYGPCPTTPGACHSHVVVCNRPATYLQPSVHTVCATPTATPSHAVPCATWTCPVGPDPDDPKR